MIAGIGLDAPGSARLFGGRPSMSAVRLGPAIFDSVAFGAGAIYCRLARAGGQAMTVAVKKPRVSAVTEVTSVK
jgi:hypothetical protein